MPIITHRLRNPARVMLLPLLALWLFHPAPLRGAEKEPNLVVLAMGPETTELLRRIGEPLAQAADLPPKEVRFHVVLNPTLNAFAMLNRHIVLNSGLLLAVRDRDELAGVMAHEIGHLKAGHHLQLESLSQKLSIQTLITTAAGILAGVASRDGRVSQAMITGGMASAQTNMLESIRRKESQADRLAVSLLARTGFNPDGLARFMNRLVQQQRIASLPPPYLLTHPITTERLLDAQRMASEEPANANNRPDQKENQLLDRMRAILEAETHDSPEESIQRFRERLKLDPGNLALEQGLAESLRAAGKLPEAETLFNTLVKQYPNDPYLLRHRGVTRIEMGRFAEAEQDLKAAIAGLPDQADLQFRLAFALKEQQKPLESIRILRQLAAQYPDEPRYFYLLGICESQAGHPGEGHLAMGRHNVLIQERDNAIWHFREAMRLLPAGSPERDIAQREEKLAKEMERKPEPQEKERKRR
ncbi:MAG: M48 family metalloprotease [Magnetococcales bacterium]|nr:M48 family metalloprotease [Magnetococcales bacterium]